MVNQLSDTPIDYIKKLLNKKTKVKNKRCTFAHTNINGILTNHKGISKLNHLMFELEVQNIKVCSIVEHHLTNEHELMDKIPATYKG